MLWRVGIYTKELMKEAVGKSIALKIRILNSLLAGGDALKHGLKVKIQKDVQRLQLVRLERSARHMLLKR
jgi:hypothetical protein